MCMLSEILTHAAVFEQWALCTVEDVPAGDFTAQPAGLTNHPAWVMGHLTYAMDNVTRQLGGTVSRDESWYQPFIGGSEPTDDASAYPDKDALLAAFRDAAATARNAVRNAGEKGLAAPVEDERLSAFFPTMGRWALHAIVCEAAFHTGQLSAWRKARGMGSVFANEANIARMMEVNSAHATA